MLAWYWVVLIGIGCAWLGYQFCLLRNSVKEFHALVRLFSQHLRGEITPEQLRDEVQKVLWWVK